MRAPTARDGSLEIGDGFSAEEFFEVGFVFCVSPLCRKPTRLHEGLDAFAHRVVLDVLTSDSLIFLTAVIMPLQIPQDIRRAG